MAVTSCNILNLDIELYRGYLNTGFICHDFLKKSLKYSDFFYYRAHIPLLIWTKSFSWNWIASCYLCTVYSKEVYTRAEENASLLLFAIAVIAYIN